MQRQTVGLEEKSANSGLKVRSLAVERDGGVKRFPSTDSGPE